MPIPSNPSHRWISAGRGRLAGFLAQDGCMPRIDRVKVAARFQLYRLHGHATTHRNNRLSPVCGLDRINGWPHPCLRAARSSQLEMKLSSAFAGYRCRSSHKPCQTSFRGPQCLLSKLTPARSFGPFIPVQAPLLHLAKPLHQNVFCPRDLLLVAQRQPSVGPDSCIVEPIRLFLLPTPDYTSPGPRLLIPPAILAPFAPAHLK